MVLCSGCKKSYPNRYAWKYQNLHWKWKANAQQFIESYREVILEETWLIFLQLCKLWSRKMDQKYLWRKVERTAQQLNLFCLY